VSLVILLVVVLVSGDDDEAGPAPSDEASLPDEPEPPPEIPVVPPQDDGPARDAATTTVDIGGSQFRFTSTGRAERFPTGCVDTAVCTEAAAGNVLFLIEMTTTQPLASDGAAFDSPVNDATDLASLTVDGEEVSRSVTSISPTQVTLAFEVPDDTDPATFVLHLPGHGSFTGFEAVGA
jgi:hypothetical protein